MIDQIRSLKELIIYEVIEALCRVTNNYCLSKPSRLAIENFDKIKNIMEKARIRENKIVTPVQLKYITDEIIATFC